MKRLILLLCIGLLAACSEPAPMPSPDPTPNTPSPTEPAPSDPDPDDPDPDDPDPTEPSPDDPSPDDPGQPGPDGPTPPSETDLLADITFMGPEGSSSYDTSGKASIIRDGDELRLELASDFKTTPGPDLYVWLVKDKDSPEGFFEVDRLKSDTGAQTYTLNLVNVDDYEALYIWCKDFGVLFGSGVLEKL